MKRLVNTPRGFRGAALRGTVLLAILLLVSAGRIFASVLIAPTVVVLSDQKRTGRIILRNPGDTPKEVSVWFSFGLPESDSLGNVSVQLDDSAVADPRSAATWIKAFPRKLVLPAGAQQIVRFVANPPKNLADGEYWARVVVSSQSAAAALPTDTEEGQISAKINSIIQTAISLKYRTGDLSAALDVGEPKANLTDGKVEVMIDMTNRGNVSYLGLLRCRLIDAEKKEVCAMSQNVAVYYDLRRRIDLPVPDSGFVAPYQVEMTITTTGRTDVPSTEIVPGNRVEYLLAVE